MAPSGTGPPPYHAVDRGMDTSHRANESASSRTLNAPPPAQVTSSNRSFQGYRANTQPEVPQLQDSRDRMGNDAKPLASKWGPKFKNMAKSLEGDSLANPDEQDEEPALLKKHSRKDRKEREKQAQEIAELEAKLRSEKESNSRIKQGADKILMKLEAKELFLGQQAEDDEIQQMFISLMAQIRTWSIPFARHPSDNPTMFYDLNPAAEAEMRQLMPGCTNIDQALADVKIKRLFVRGWVGKNIASSILKETDVWMPPSRVQDLHGLEDHLAQACNRNVISWRNFHDWRALTCSLLSKSLELPDLVPHDGQKQNYLQAKLNDLSTAIISPIAHWVQSDQLRSLETSLVPLYEQAIGLARLLRRQRASWSIHYSKADSIDPSQNLPYYPAHMRDRNVVEEEGEVRNFNAGPRGNIQQGKFVQLVVTPGLFKRGTPEGERYEQESCLEQMEVVCREVWS